MTKKLTYRTALAPMAGVTDYAFRSACRHFGAEYLYTEMVSAKACRFEDKKTAQIGRLYPSEAPIAVQIFGSDPVVMAACAADMSRGSYRYCESEVLPAAIDINMGCPAPKVSGGGDGSALLRTPELAAEIVRACAMVSNVPVTVKIRIGWDEGSINGVDFAKRMEAAGASAITVHGRTREGRFSAPINFDEIRRIKEAVSIPVIGNGGIFSARDALTMFERTGCDAVMIGRGALGSPWLFGEIAAALDKRDFVMPTQAERVAIALKELRMRMEEKGERMGLLESRKLLAWYIKGLRGAASARDAINRADSYETVQSIMERLVTEDETT